MYTTSGGQAQSSESMKLPGGTKERIRCDSTIRFNNPWFFYQTPGNRCLNGVVVDVQTSHRLTLELQKVLIRLCGSADMLRQFSHDDQVLRRVVNSNKLF